MLDLSTKYTLQWVNDAISINRSINLIIDYFSNRLIDFNRLIIAALLQTISWNDLTRDWTNEREMKRVIKDSKLSMSVHYYNMYTYKHRHYTLTWYSESHNSVHSIVHRVPAGFYQLLSIGRNQPKYLLWHIPHTWNYWSYTTMLYFNMDTGHKLTAHVETQFFCKFLLLLKHPKLL